MTKTIFTKSHTPVPNYEGATILNSQISQNFFAPEFMLPDSKNIFDALFACTKTWHSKKADLFS